MAKRKHDDSHSPTIENRKARFDYAIEEELEVGIILSGSEVKSVRESKVSLAEGFVRAAEFPPQLLLFGVNILGYAPAASMGHKPVRPRGLLAHKREIIKLARKQQVKGMTIVPLKMYFKNGYAKLLIGVGKGRKSHDKRNAIGEREAKRDIEKAMARAKRH
jgi:SsrA-binding protein